MLNNQMFIIMKINNIPIIEFIKTNILILFMFIKRFMEFIFGCVYEKVCFSKDNKRDFRGCEI